MEFHIAHEKMIQGRKKYLIPLMLEHLHPTKVQDPDLRMYIESHTYLDCKDEVESFSFSFSIKFGQTSFSCVQISHCQFQENMKKRLHYAMPRVPLQILKGTRGNQALRDEPVSHVGTISKRIIAARAKTHKYDGGKGNMADTMNTQFPNEAARKRKHRRNIQFARHKITKKNKRHKPVHKAQPEGLDLSSQNTIPEKKAMFKQFDLDRKEQKSLNEIEHRLRKTRGRKSLRFVLIDGDSSELSSTTSGTDFSSDSEMHGTVTDVSSEAREVTDKDSQVMGAEIGVGFEVCADVHKEPESHDEDELEGAVGGLVEAGPVAARKKTKPNTTDVGIETASDSSFESDHSETKRAFKPWFGKTQKIYNLKIEQLNKFETDSSGVKWGQDERSDSESDEGWIDDERMTLL